MTRGKLLTKLFAAAVTVGVAASAAPAGLLPVSVSVTPEASNFRWTYAIVLPTDMKLQAGNYFTIYDFNGFVPGSQSGQDGWTFSTNKTGPTPDRLKPTDGDQADNLTWTYNGPTIESGQIGLGNFMATSTFGTLKDSSFTAHTNRTSDGLVDNNITVTSVPTGATDTGTGGGGPVVTPPGVPEPATLALAAIGLPVAALIRRKRSN